MQFCKVEICGVNTAKLKVLKESDIPDRLNSEEDQEETK